MPPTREQIDAALESLPEDQHAIFLAEVERRMQPEPEKRSPYGPSPMNPMASAVGGLLPIQSDSDPAEVERGVRAGSAVAAGVGVAVAAPMAALKMVGRGAGAYAVEEGVDYGAQAVGVPPYWADKMGDAAGWMTLIGSGGLTRLISMLGLKAAKKKLKNELVQVVVKNEADKLRTTAILRTQGYTSAQIEKAIIMEAPKAAAPAVKAATKAATAAVPAAKSAPRAGKTLGDIITKEGSEKPWRVVIQYGKHKGKSGVKIKHGMGRGQTRPGGGAGPRHDTIRLDDGSEVVVPSTNVLTDFGKATHPSVQKAIDASRQGSASATAEATQIASKIRTLKNTHKLSDAQVVNTLRELYAIKAKDARALIRMVMEK